MGFNCWKAEEQLWVIWVCRVETPGCLTIQRNIEASTWLTQGNTDYLWHLQDGDILATGMKCVPVYFTWRMLDSLWSLVWQSELPLKIPPSWTKLKMTLSLDKEGKLDKVTLGTALWVIAEERHQGRLSLPVSKTLNDVENGLQLVTWSHPWLPPWLLDHFSCYLAKTMEKKKKNFLQHVSLSDPLCSVQTCTYTCTHVCWKRQWNRRIKI